MVFEPRLLPGFLPEKAGRARPAGNLFSVITGNGVRIIGPKGDANLDDLGFLEVKERGHDIQTDIPRRCLCSGVDGFLHDPDKLGSRIRIMGGIDGVEPADNGVDLVHFSPGGGKRQENAISERNVGGRDCLLDFFGVPVSRKKDGLISQGRAADLAEVHLENLMREAEPSGQPSAAEELDSVPLTIVEAQRYHPGVLGPGPIKGSGGIDPSREKDYGLFDFWHSLLYLILKNAMAFCKRALQTLS